MRTVRMQTTAAGPAGIRRAGEVYTVQDNEADALIADGAAVPVASDRARPNSEAAMLAAPRPRQRGMGRS